MSNLADEEFHADFHYGPTDNDGHVDDLPTPATMSELAEFRAKYGISEEPPF